MVLRSFCALFILFLVAGHSNAARAGTFGVLEHNQHEQHTRSLLQRQKSAASKAERPQASAASSGSVRPRSDQQGSITARNNRVADSRTPTKAVGNSDTTNNIRAVGSLAASRQGNANAAKQSVSSASSRRGPDRLDFGNIPTLDLGSGLENMQDGLSGLIDEFRQQGGFWKEGSLQDNISNMVQLGVKGTLGVVSPLVNGLTGGIPITVPSINGKCLQGKPIRTTSTGLFGSKKRVTRCLIGTGSQVADYLSKAAGSLAGMAGEVLNRPAQPLAGALQSPEVPAGDAAAAGQAVAAAPAAGPTTDNAPTAEPTSDASP